MFSHGARREGESGSERSWILLLGWDAVGESLRCLLPWVLLVGGFGPVVRFERLALDMKRTFCGCLVGALNCLGMRGLVDGWRHGWVVAIVHGFLSFLLCCGCDC